MRLKRLLGALLAVLICSLLAMATEPQLTDVNIASKGNTTTITLKTSGAFTHNEYRPAETLMLVDLTGVSAGKLQDTTQALQAAGVKSYRVVGYSGAGGVEITRLELTVVPGAQVKVVEGKSALSIEIVAPLPTKTEVAAVTVSIAGSASPPQEDASTTQKKTEKTTTAASTKPVFVRNVAVTQQDQAVQVEIQTTGVVQPSIMKLSSPDRLVIDLPNAVLPRNIPATTVNSGAVKFVRVGRYQSDPPITRVVVDSHAPLAYEVQQESNKLVVSVRPEQVGPAPTPAESSPAIVENARQPAPPVPQALETTQSVLEILKAPEAVQAAGSDVSASALDAAPSPEPSDVAQTPALQPNSSLIEQDHKGSEQSAVAANFAVIEPEYEPKAETKPAAAPEPPVVSEPPVMMATSTPPIPPTPVPAAELPQAESAAPTPQAEPTAPEPLAEPAAPAPQAEPPAPAIKPAIQPQAAVNFAAEQQRLGTEPVKETRRFTGEPISVNLKDVDLKDFFRLIHEISKLNIVLDPTVGGSLTLVLDDVPWDQALEIVLRNNNLEKQLDGNVLRIARVETLKKEAEARLAQQRAQALAVDKVGATRFLSYAHARDVLPTIKKVLSPRGDIVADERTNALIIHDIPSVIPEIDRLLRQLDRKTQEVEIEGRVVAATRAFARDIGFQLGFGWGNGPSAVGGVNAVGTSPLQVGSGVVPNPMYFITGQGQIPLFSNFPVVGPTSGISFNNSTNSYRIDALLTMAETRGLLKILSRPRVVTQNNIQAVVRQGVKIPVVTQGQLAGPPTVTYINAVLQLTVTPQITADNTIFLNVDVENTTPDFGRVVNGNPTLITQQATTQVLVTDGGTVVIGGVIQTNNSVNVSQVPLLGNVPGLGNLFKRRAVKTETQELIFFITPRIVET